MIEAIEPLVSAFASSPEAGSILLLGIYLAYEIRLGTMREVRSDQHTMALALYRVIEHTDGLDEQAFRNEMWGENGEGLILQDLDVDPMAEEKEGS